MRITSYMLLFALNIVTIGNIMLYNDLMLIGLAPA